jgi:hypothetical protein
MEFKKIDLSLARASARSLWDNELFWDILIASMILLFLVKNSSDLKNLLRIPTFDFLLLT